MLKLEKYSIGTGDRFTKQANAQLNAVIKGKGNFSTEVSMDETDLPQTPEELLFILSEIAKEGIPAQTIAPKFSVHSGSDKFSIYPSIRKNIRKYNAGVHVKTAGTTWLEELTGLDIAKEVYSSALNRYEELAEPYATVIDIDKTKLPAVSEVESWTGKQYASSLRHAQNNPAYNMHLRQLLHVGYKVASEMGDRALDALVKNSEIVGKNVTESL